MSDRPATARAKIKCTDQLGNVAYIHNDSGHFRCVLANGIQAAMSYAVGTCDEVDLKHRLTEALDDPERLLRIVRAEAGNRRVEMLSYKAAPKAEDTAKQLLKALVLAAPASVVYATEDGTTYTGKEMATEIEGGSKVAAKFTKELLTSGLRAMKDAVEIAVEQLPAPSMGR